MTIEFEAVEQFRKENRLLTVGAIAAIFTWALVNSLRVNVVEPLVLSRFPASIEALRFHVGADSSDDTVVNVGAFLAELFIWIVVVIPLWAGWAIFKHKSKQ